jgi:hypothetical protein
VRDRGVRQEGEGEVQLQCWVMPCAREAGVQADVAARPRPYKPPASHLQLEAWWRQAAAQRRGLPLRLRELGFAKCTEVPRADVGLVVGAEPLAKARRVDLEGQRSYGSVEGMAEGRSTVIEGLVLCCTLLVSPAAAMGTIL